MELDKILEEIEQIRRKTAENGNFNVAAAYENSMKIICKHLSHESTPEITRLSRDNDGWTPVEERLPEVEEETEETIEDDDCPEYIVTIRDAVETTVLKYSPDGSWFDKNGYVYDVIAWMPLPAPYSPERRTR